MPRKDFDFFRRFKELFVFVIKYPVMNLPGSWPKIVGPCGCGACDFCLKKNCPTHGILIDPGIFITGAPLTNTNNSTNIRKIQNRFWTWLLGPGYFIWRKKPRRKSRDTVLFKVVQKVSSTIMLNFDLKGFSWDFIKALFLAVVYTLKYFCIYRLITQSHYWLRTLSQFSTMLQN